MPSVPEAMKSWRALMSAVCAACFVGLLVVNGMATRPEGKFFRSRTADVSDRYRTEITPAPWAFGIWGLIYVWLVCILAYILSTFYRRATTGGTVGVPRERGIYEDSPAAHPFFLACLSMSFLFLAAWLWLFDRENIVGSAAVLWVATFFIFVAGIFHYVTLYEKGWDLNLQKPSELWINRILVQNGFEVYGTWVMFCALLNTVMAAQYPPAGAVSWEPDVAGIIGIGLLLFAFLAWFPFEITVFDKYCRYGVAQYLVAAFAMGAIYSVRGEWNKGGMPMRGNSALEKLVLAFMLVSLGMFFVKLFLIAYRARHKPLFSTRPPPLAPTRAGTIPLAATCGVGEQQIATTGFGSSPLGDAPPGKGLVLAEESSTVNVVPAERRR